MKYLSNYTEQGITDLLTKYGAFFAFSGKQFDEAKKEGVKYTNMGAGLICPSEHVQDFMTGLENNHANGIKQDIAENGKEAIIRRELANHEAYYTYEIDDTVDSLAGYDITREEVQEVFNKHVHHAF